jgi:DNA-binding NtrC family response regulator
MINKQIVVVDGNETWRELSVSTLRAEGYEIKSFNDHEQALKYLRFHESDLLLADYNWMKSNRAKWEKFIREGSWHGRLLLLLTSHNPSLVRECFKLGAYDCVLKPRNVHKLSNLVQTAMQRSVSQAAGG